MVRYKTMPLLKSVKEKQRTKKAPEGIGHSSGGTGSYYYDGFRRKQIRSANLLIAEYKRLCYTCGNRNATGVTNTPLRLYLMTSNGDGKTLLREEKELKKLTTAQKIALKEHPNLKKRLRTAIEIEEVIDHPLLELLQRANTSRFISGVLLSELTQLYLDFTGNAYWLIERDGIFSNPKSIWILPSQWVTPVVNENSKNVIDEYEFNPPGQSQTFKYSYLDIIHFKNAGLNNPYVEGKGALAACFDSNEVNNKLLSHENTLLSKEARPDALLMPKGEDGYIDPIMARRLEHEWAMRFGNGKIGGIYVPQEELSWVPLQIPPRDLARLEIGKVSAVDIANCFDVPYALVSDASHNRQQLEAAMTLHAMYGIAPRLKRKECVLNDLFVTEFDETGRLFLAHDNPVPENRAEKLSEISVLVMNGIFTPNEGREAYDKPPLPDGDELRAINVSPDVMDDKKEPKKEPKDSNDG